MMNRLLACGLLLLVGCTGPKARVGEKPVLQVNDHVLNAQEFSDRLARKLRQFDALTVKDPLTLNRSKEDVLRAFTLESLILDYAKANSLTVSDQELDQEINNFRSAYPDDVAFRHGLAEENLSLADWRLKLRTTLLERKVFQKIIEKIPKPNSEELKKAFDDSKDKFRRKERVYLRQILVDDKAKATELHDELKKKSFTDLATRFSQAPEGKQGGLIGWVEKGTLEVFDKAFTLPIGQVSQVLESPYGFHILKVERKAPAGFATIEEVKPFLEETLKSQKEQGEFTSWLDRQIRTSRVMRDPELVRAISVETRKGRE